MFDPFFPEFHRTVQFSQHTHTICLSFFLLVPLTEDSQARDLHTQKITHPSYPLSPRTTTPNLQQHQPTVTDALQNTHADRHKASSLTQRSIQTDYWQPASRSLQQAVVGHMHRVRERAGTQKRTKHKRTQTTHRAIVNKILGIR